MCSCAGLTERWSAPDTREHRCSNARLERIHSRLGQGNLCTPPRRCPSSTRTSGQSRLGGELSASSRPTRTDRSCPPFFSNAERAAWGPAYERATNERIETRERAIALKLLL